MEGVHRMEESRVYHQDLFSPLRMGQRVRRDHGKSSATELRMRPVDWTCRNGGRGEDLQLAFFLLQLAYMLPWSEWPLGSQGVPAEAGG